MKRLNKIIVFASLLALWVPVSATASGRCVADQYPQKLDGCSGWEWGCSGSCQYYNQWPLTPVCKNCICYTGFWYKSCTAGEDGIPVVVQVGSVACYVGLYGVCLCDNSQIIMGLPSLNPCGTATGDNC